MTRPVTLTGVVKAVSVNERPVPAAAFFRDGVNRSAVRVNVELAGDDGGRYFFDSPPAVKATRRKDVTVKLPGRAGDWMDVVDGVVAPKLKVGDRVNVSGRLKAERPHYTRLSHVRLIPKTEQQTLC